MHALDLNYGIKWIDLNWIWAWFEMHWTELIALTWFELNWTQLTWTALNEIELYWIGLSRLDWAELDWINITWIEYHCFELTWNWRGLESERFELNRKWLGIRLALNRNCIDLDWVDLAACLTIVGNNEAKSNTPCSPTLLSSIVAAHPYPPRCPLFTLHVCLATYPLRAHPLEKARANWILPRNIRIQCGMTSDSIRKSL